jgi:hypothetical protein
MIGGARPRSTHSFIGISLALRGLSTGKMVSCGGGIIGTAVIGSCIAALVHEGIISKTFSGRGEGGAGDTGVLALAHTFSLSRVHL